MGKYQTENSVLHAEVTLASSTGYVLWASISSPMSWTSQNWRWVKELGIRGPIAPNLLGSCHETHQSKFHIDCFVLLWHHRCRPLSPDIWNVPCTQTVLWVDFLESFPGKNRSGHFSYTLLTWKIMTYRATTLKLQRDGTFNMYIYILTYIHIYIYTYTHTPNVLHPQLQINLSTYTLVNLS